MKIFFNVCLLSLTTACAIGQTVNVSGTVSNEKGQPVPFAFVRDANHNYATYADSTGTFMLKADPTSSLLAVANSYKDTGLKLENKTKVDIVMPAGTPEVAVGKANESAGAANESFISNRQMMVTGQSNMVTTDLKVKTGFNQEETRGSRYLFDDWVPGFGLSKKDSVVNEITNMYNYDKINGNLLYTNDKRSMAGISNAQIASFTLFDHSGHAHVFENAPAVSKMPFVEVLISTPKYKIYKRIDTRLDRADFHTDGVVETGHRYDEYVDVTHYYFVGEDGKPQSISLKKSTLKKLIGADADAFIIAQGRRDVDEEYVKDLGKSLVK